MKVIFVHDVGGVGKRNDIKDVADGYAMNFLIRNGHAVQATTEKVKALQAKLAVDKRAVDEKHKHIIQGLERIRGANIRILARANATGGLYKELTATEILSAVQREYGVHVPPDALHIGDPIKKVGARTLTISQGGLTADIRVVVEKNGN